MINILFKILNVKGIFNTVKDSGQTLFFRAKAKLLKMMFRAGSSCSKILNGKKCIRYSEKFQGKLVFLGKRKLFKSPEG